LIAHGEGASTKGSHARTAEVINPRVRKSLGQPDAGRLYSSRTKIRGGLVDTSGGFCARTWTAPSMTASTHAA
jgi:hypothetical protein